MFLYIYAPTGRILAASKTFHTFMSGLLTDGTIVRKNYLGPIPAAFIKTLNDWLMLSGVLTNEPLTADDAGYTLAKAKFHILRSLQHAIVKVRWPHTKQLILQNQTYALKTAEAVLYLQDPTNTVDDFSLLTASAAAHGNSVSNEATAIVVASEKTTLALKNSEIVRVTEEAAILAATSVDELKTIKASLKTNPLLAK